MNKFNVKTDIISIFYYSTTGGVFRYSLVTLCGNAIKADIQRIDNIIRKPSKVIRIH